MSNHWIVSAYEFAQHAKLDGARAERDRLAAKFPKKRFRIYRIKGNLQPTNSQEHIASVEARADRAVELLRAVLLESDRDTVAYEQARAFLEDQP